MVVWVYYNDVDRESKSHKGELKSGAMRSGNFTQDLAIKKYKTKRRTKL